MHAQKGIMHDVLDIRRTSLDPHPERHRVAAVATVERFKSRRLSRPIEGNKLAVVTLEKGRCGLARTGRTPQLFPTGLVDDEPEASFGFIGASGQSHQVWTHRLEKAAQFDQQIGEKNLSLAYLVGAPIRHLLKRSLRESLLILVISNT
jgi:hypothetical protein